MAMPARVEVPMLRVVVEREGRVLDDRLFSRTTISIGRLPENDVVIDDAQVSARHLVVRNDPDSGFRVFDQSSNGTYWEGGRISTLRFERETVLRLAAYHVTLIPVLRSGTEQLGAPGIDLFARTAIDKPLPADEDAQETAEHQSLQSPLVELPPAELRAISNDGELRSLVFRGRALVGRAPECDLRLGAPDISRQHALITSGPSSYVIRRLSQKNPLQVNEHELASGDSMTLRDGDVIRICDEEVVFLCPATQSLERGTTMPGEASPNFDLAVSPRGCFNPRVAAVDVIGFLGVKTFPKFEDQLRHQLRSARLLLIDLGYLIGIDREGLASLGRMISEADRVGVKVQLIRVTPRIADLLSYSELRHLLTNFISRTEETAVRRLLG
ncbi:MAG: FHA domain-containing protein [Acidobacteria bacterium]|nr:FHA domain-containing protein [Acidobacteriota bacterium]